VRTLGLSDLANLPVGERTIAPTARQGPRARRFRARVVARTTIGHPLESMQDATLA
jgi:hypothetical protein